jgi:uncharacterized UPF0160 family protein
MLSCIIWFSTPGFWMGGGLESRCVGCVYGADSAVHQVGISNYFTQISVRYNIKLQSVPVIYAYFVRFWCLPLLFLRIKITSQKFKGLLRQERN